MSLSLEVLSVCNLYRNVSAEAAALEEAFQEATLLTPRSALCMRGWPTIQQL
jgi:hypothetical protein